MEVLFLPCSYNTHAIGAALLAGDLKDKKRGAGEKYCGVEERKSSQQCQSQEPAEGMQIKCSKSVNQNSCHFNKSGIEQSDD